MVRLIWLFWFFNILLIGVYLTIIIIIDKFYISKSKNNLLNQKYIDIYFVENWKLILNYYQKLYYSLIFPIVFSSFANIVFIYFIFYVSLSTYESIFASFTSGFTVVTSLIIFVSFWITTLIIIFRKNHDHQTIYLKEENKKHVCFLLDKESYIDHLYTDSFFKRRFIERIKKMKSKYGTNNIPVKKLTNIFVGYFMFMYESKTINDKTDFDLFELFVSYDDPSFEKESYFSFKGKEISKYEFSLRVQKEILFLFKNNNYIKKEEQPK